MNPWVTLLLSAGVSGVIAYLVARVAAKQQTREESAHTTIIAIWEALEKAERGFHEPHQPSGNALHTWAAGLGDAWADMERAGILVRRLPNRGYRDLKKLLDPLADEWPDADQMTKMGILRDSQVHPAEGMWRGVMPSDDSIDRIRKGLVAVRPHASKKI